MSNYNFFHFDYTGGLYWDILLITPYSDKWEDFYNALINVLPCDKCIKKTIQHHEEYPVPKFKSTEEKNEYLWKLRIHRGGINWRQDVEKKGYTLESWLNLFKDKPFTKIID